MAQRPGGTTRPRISATSPAGRPRPPGRVTAHLAGDGWWAFLARRTGRFVLSLIALSALAFFVIHLVPGDPVRAALGTSAPPALVEARRAALGLDDPLPVQLWHYWTGLATGDWGVSLGSQLPVADVIGSRLWHTLQLAVLALGVVMVIAIPLGLVMAILTQNGRRRRTELGFTSAATTIGAIPEFLLAVGLVYVFAVSWDILPIAGRAGPASYLLPVIALALGPAASMARIVRVEVLTVLDADYLRTARSKRLRPWLIYLRHALPNALTATLTLGGLLLTSLIAGTVLVENVFAWPGLGTTIVQSIAGKDYPLVQGIVLVYGVLVLTINLLVDVLLSVLDKRSAIRTS